MDVPVFLTHYNTRGTASFTNLDRYDTCSTFYLPNASSEDREVSYEPDCDHSFTRIDVELDHYLLSVHSNVLGPTTVLLNERSIEMPISTANHQKSIILTENNQFITASGRWQLIWDRSGEISNLMRTPDLSAYDDTSNDELLAPIELISSRDGSRLVARSHGESYASSEEHTPIPVVDIRLPPCISTGSDTSGSDHDREEGRLDLPDDKTDAPSSVAGGSTNPTGEDLSAPFLDIRKPRMIMGGFVSKALSDHENPTQETGRSKANRGRLMQNSSENVLEIEGASVQRVPALEEACAQGDTEEAESDTRPLSSHKVSLSIISGHDREYSEVSEQEKQADSDDESQHQRDVRKPKRLIQEIEAETRQTKAKRQKTNEKTKSTTITTQTMMDEDHSEKIVVKTPLTRRSVSFADASDPQPKDREKISKSKVGKRKPQAGSSLPLISISEHTQNERRSPRRSSEMLSTATSAAPVGCVLNQPKIIFGSTSSIAGDKKAISKIEKLGGTVTTDINHADVLCIGYGPLKKTSKFIIAVAKGKEIVTDDWIKQACATQKFPDCNLFLPEASQQEEEWHFVLTDALDRGKRGLTLLHGYHMYLTAQLRIDLGGLAKELKNVASVLGATKCHSCLPPKATKHKVIVIGSIKNVDPEVAKVGHLGHRLYSQDLLTMSALRGKLELDSDEFLIPNLMKNEPLSE